MVFGVNVIVIGVRSRSIDNLVVGDGRWGNRIDWRMDSRINRGVVNRSRVMGNN